MLFEDRTANEFAALDFIPDLKMRGFHPPACPSREDDIVIDDIDTVFTEEGRVEMTGDRTLFVEPAVIESLVFLKAEFSNIPYEVK